MCVLKPILYPCLKALPLKVVADNNPLQSHLHSSQNAVANYSTTLTYVPPGKKLIFKQPLLIRTAIYLYIESRFIQEENCDLFYKHHPNFSTHA